jgi:uncharacterized protein
LSRLCPICAKEIDARFKPFCSNRCKLVDLNSWLTGNYAIPVESDEDEDGDGVQAGIHLSSDKGRE